MTQKRRQSKEFEQLKDNAIFLWHKQTEKAKQADKLLRECEEMEQFLNKVIDDMQKYHKEDFEKWIAEFQEKTENQESLVKENG